MKIFKNIYFWGATSLLLTIILGIIYAITNSSLLYDITVISCIPWVLFIIVTLIYAWIVNPIQRRRQK